MTEPTAPAGVNTPALYSLFCGVIAIPTAFLFGLGAIFGISGIILGRIGLARANAGEGKRGLALGGLALSAIAIAMVVAYLIDQA